MFSKSKYFNDFIQNNLILQHSSFISENLGTENWENLDFNTIGKNEHLIKKNIQVWSAGPAIILYDKVLHMFFAISQFKRKKFFINLNSLCKAAT